MYIRLSFSDYWRIESRQLINKIECCIHHNILITICVVSAHFFVYVHVIDIFLFLVKISNSILPDKDVRNETISDKNVVFVMCVIIHPDTQIHRYTDPHTNTYKNTCTHMNIHTLTHSHMLTGIQATMHTCTHKFLLGIIMDMHQW